MKLIIHDLTNEEAMGIIPHADENTEVFAASPRVSPCTSCFGCWLKTPGICVIDDRARDFNKLMAEAGELHIVSEMLYGGLSVDIKTVLDRSLGFILPYFDIKDDLMHHPPRYDKNFIMHYHIYSFDDTAFDTDEMETMRGIANANARNFTAFGCSCSFYNTQEELKEAIK